jgi:sortase B
VKNKRLIIEILSLLIFLGCAAYIGMYYYNSHTAQNDISQLREKVEEQTKADTVQSQDGQEKEIITYMDNGMMSKYYPLYEQNNDMVGWLKVDGTDIDYPVMYTNTGNDFYMHHNFEKEKQYSGLPFLDYECDMVRSTNLIIYGHNMKDGTMFSALLKYDDKAFFEQYGDIQFDTLYEQGKYRVIGAFYAKHDSDFRYYEFTNAADEEEFEEYIENVKDNSLYDTGESVRYGDKLLTLSTCSYNTNDERFVVVAKRVYE